MKEQRLGPVPNASKARPKVLVDSVRKNLTNLLVIVRFVIPDFEISSNFTRHSLFRLFFHQQQKGKIMIKKNLIFFKIRLKCQFLSHSIVIIFNCIVTKKREVHIFLSVIWLICMSINFSLKRFNLSKLLKYKRRFIDLPICQLLESVAIVT